ncbi:hypothetical protein KM043_017242 [Ampulex compressa]|nr:hypothetical protein KM043_017242 [Ampulex compressa]
MLDSRHGIPRSWQGPTIKGVLTVIAIFESSCTAAIPRRDKSTVDTEIASRPDPRCDFMLDEISRSTLRPGSIVQRIPDYSRNTYPRSSSESSTIELPLTSSKQDSQAVYHLKADTP